MSSLRFLGSYVRIQLLDLLRRPGFVIPSLVFPPLFFSFFDLPFAHAYPSMAGNMMLAYIVFAVIGVALFQFGTGMAVDRATPWERYVRTLPTPLWLRFAARSIVAGLFAMCSAAGVVIVATLFTTARFAPQQWLLIAACALAGAVPFVLFGLAIGYWTSPKAAPPIASMCYMLLAFIGGLWLPPALLPRFAQVISPFTPARQFAELLWHAPHGVSFGTVAALVAFALFFAAFAAAGYRRERATRFA